MKLTSAQLQQLIKEELERFVSEMFAPSGQARMDDVGNIMDIKNSLQQVIFDNPQISHAQDTILHPFDREHVDRQTISDQIGTAMKDDPENAEIYRAMIIDNDLPEPN